MSVWQIGPVTLPGDLEWTDELAWTARKQTEDISLAGGSVIQRSVQTAGRPITLTTPERVFVARQQVLDLQDHHDDPTTQQFTVTHPDGRQFQCRYRHENTGPIAAANALFRSPPEPDDLYNLTLRLMTA